MARHPKNPMSGRVDPMSSQGIPWAAKGSHGLPSEAGSMGCQVDPMSGQVDPTSVRGLVPEVSLIPDGDVGKTGAGSPDKASPHDRAPLADYTPDLVKVGRFVRGGLMYWGLDPAHRERTGALLGAW